MKITVFWDVALCNLADDELYDAPSQKTVSVVHQDVLKSCACAHHEGVCGIAGLAPLILNLGIEWM
jgi:hypothetical protein